MQSRAKTVSAYLKELPAVRRRAIEAVRQVILDNLPEGYEETMNYGMIGYVVPHRLYSKGYHCNPDLPLPFANLASQKNYMSLYLMTLYGPVEERFRREFKKSGKKLDMGRCCVRFKSIEDLPLEVVGRAVAAVSVKDFVAYYEATIRSARSTGRTTKAGAKKSRASGRSLAGRPKSSAKSK